MVNTPRFAETHCRAVKLPSFEISQQILDFDTSTRISGHTPPSKPRPLVQTWLHCLTLSERAVSFGIFCEGVAEWAWHNVVLIQSFQMSGISLLYDEQFKSQKPYNSRICFSVGEGLQGWCCTSQNQGYLGLFNGNKVRL